MSDARPTSMLQHNLIEKHASNATDRIVQLLKLSDPDAYWTIRSSITMAMRTALKAQENELASPTREDSPTNSG
jgi:hypothetical protein